MTQNHVIVFLLVSFSQTRSAIFPAFCGCESILVRESTVIFCFHFVSSKIQVFESWYAQTGRIHPNARDFCHISWAFLLSFTYRFGGLCRLPPPGFTNMYLYKLVIVFCYSYRFLGRQCIGSVKVQAKLKWNDRGYYTVPPVDTFYVFVSPCSKLNRTQMHKESS